MGILDVVGDEEIVTPLKSLRALDAISGVGRRPLSTLRVDMVGNVLAVSVFLRASRFSFLIGTAFGRGAKSTTDVALGTCDSFGAGGHVDGFGRRELDAESLVS